MKRAYLGVDVGWSETRASCGVAWSGVRPPELARHQRDTDNGVANVRADRLAQLLQPILDRRGQDFDELIAVIDGPIARDGHAVLGRRSVDEACVREPFVGRAQSALLEGPFGRHFVAATARILEALKPTARWVGGPVDPQGGVLVAETNPTIAMALTLTMQDPASLPSRRTARLIPNRGSIRAKSDWYWYLGAAQVAAGALGADWVVNESHHERVAALFCLGLAHALGGDARDGSQAVAMGSPAGAYLLFGKIDPSWQTAVQRVGVLFGTVENASVPTRPIGEADVAVPVLHPDDVPEEVVERDPGCLLVLTDNGGLHATANPWLNQCSFPCTVGTRTKPTATVAIQQQSGVAAPHIIEPTALTLARRYGDFAGGHLSGANPIAIPIDCPSKQ